MSTDSVSAWIDQLKRGESSAEHKLWERYFGKLVGLARHKLGSTPRKAVDEEDVALKALDSFFRGVDKGRFPDLNDRQELWILLTYLTDNKVRDVQRREFAQKRGGGQVRGEADLHDGGQQQAPSAFAGMTGKEPTPEFAAMMAEELAKRLASLSKEHKKVALAKMEGRSNEQIAKSLECSVRSVERRLRFIRTLWRADLILDADSTYEFARPSATDRRAMLDLLPSQELKEIAEAKMDGATDDELALRLKCSLANLQENIEKIRGFWR